MLSLFTFSLPGIFQDAQVVAFFRISLGISFSFRPPEVALGHSPDSHFSPLAIFCLVGTWLAVPLVPPSVLALVVFGSFCESFGWPSAATSPPCGLLSSL